MRLGLLVLLGVALVTYLSTVAISGLPFSPRYTLSMPLSASGPVLKRGDEVRIGGERAGEVRSVSLVHARGRATLELDKKVGAGTSALIRPRGLAGAVYVQLTPGDPRRPLRSGATVPASSSVQLSDVVAGFDASARSALARTVSAYGNGLSGHGLDLNRALAVLPGTLSTLTPELHALDPRPGTVSALTAGADRTAQSLADAGSVVGPAAGTLSATGSAARALAATETALPATEQQTSVTLPPADRLLKTLAPTVRALAPGVRGVTRALPGMLGLERGSARLASFATLAAHARPLIDMSSPVAADARGPIAALVPITEPLASFSRVLAPYAPEILEAPLGFTRWGDFSYDFGQAPGHKAVRFSMVFTCAHARDPYPAPGAASKERSRCR